MHSIELSYQGNLRTEATHLASGKHIVTDAPLDNHGLGQAFSPTDLLCASLAACMTTIMGISANSHQIDITGMKCNITKIMASAPRRVAGIKVELSDFPNSLNEREKALLEHAAKTCPVALSLHPDLQQELIFNW